MRNWKEYVVVAASLLLVVALFYWGPGWLIALFVLLVGVGGAGWANLTSHKSWQTAFLWLAAIAAGALVIALLIGGRSSSVAPPANQAPASTSTYRPPNAKPLPPCKELAAEPMQFSITAAPGKWSEVYCVPPGWKIDWTSTAADWNFKMKLQSDTEYTFSKEDGDDTVAEPIQQMSFMARGPKPEEITIKIHR